MNHAIKNNKKAYFYSSALALTLALATFNYTVTDADFAKDINALVNYISDSITIDSQSLEQSEPIEIASTGTGGVGPIDPP